MPDSGPATKSTPFEQLSGGDRKQGDEEKDPMQDYVESLQKWVEKMTASADTDSDPMSMLSSDKEAQSSLNGMDDASESDDASLDSSSDLSEGADLSMT